MGLDNGIILKNSTIKKEDIPEYIKITTFEHSEYGPIYDICYWRKCRNIREDMFDIITEVQGQYEYELTREDVNEFINALYYYIQNPDAWEQDRGELVSSRSIWTFEEILESLAQDLVNLYWLYKLMSNPRFKGDVYFYDSY